MRRTKEDAAKTRKLILQTALICFDEQGYEYTSLNDIAKRANLSRGAIYWHFANKSDIFQSIAEEQLSQILADLEGHLNNKHSWQHIAKFWQDFFRQLYEIPDRMRFFRLMEQACRNSTALQNIDRKYMTLWQQLSQRAILAGIREGDIHPDNDPEWLHLYTRTVMSGLLTMHLHYPDYPNLLEHSNRIIASHISSLQRPL